MFLCKKMNIERTTNKRTDTEFRKCIKYMMLLDITEVANIFCACRNCIQIIRAERKTGTYVDWDAKIEEEEDKI